MVRVAFLHPDLGIGGAERLIVDCALALKGIGHHVIIFTSHHDSSHCFAETTDGQLEVVTAGDWIPRSTFGHFKAAWAYIRMLYLCLYFVWHHQNQYDLTICDLISAGLPILRLFKQKCLFYGHFPDQLLTTKDSFLKKLYRYPIDFFERFSLSYAQLVLVNSMFTKEVFERTFPSLQIPLKVLYPTVNFSVFDRPMTGTLDITLEGVDTLFLSINRYERKKNHALAIESLKELYDTNGWRDKKSRSRVHLIIAGGYDLQNVENIEHHRELINCAKQLEIEQHVTFLCSPSDEQKQLLLHSCTAVIYTPTNEHFGIVPLEAMYMHRPVISTNTGGPRETVLHRETGFLCSSNVTAFSHAMDQFVKDKSLSREMGIRGHEHVVKKFNFKSFQTQLGQIVGSLCEKENDNK